MESIEESEKGAQHAVGGKGAHGVWIALQTFGEVLHPRRNLGIGGAQVPALEFHHVDEHQLDQIRAGVKLGDQAAGGRACQGFGCGGLRVLQRQQQ